MWFKHIMQWILIHSNPQGTSVCLFYFIIVSIFLFRCLINPLTKTLRWIQGTFWTIFWRSHLWILLYVSCSSWHRILGSSTADSRHTLPMASWGTTWTGISILSYLVVIQRKWFNNTAVLRYWVHKYKASNEVINS